MIADGEGAYSDRSGGVRARRGACSRRGRCRALHARDDGGNEHAPRTARRANCARHDTGFEHVLHGRRDHTSTVHARRPPSHSCRSDAATAFASASGRAVCSSARPLVRSGRVGRGHCGLHPRLIRVDQHEATIANELRRRYPEAHVIASHEIAPEFRE